MNGEYVIDHNTFGGTIVFKSLMSSSSLGIMRNKDDNIRKSSKDIKIDGQVQS